MNIPFHFSVLFTHLQLQLLFCCPIEELISVDKKNNKLKRTPSFHQPIETTPKARVGDSRLMTIDTNNTSNLLPPGVRGWRKLGLSFVLPRKTQPPQPVPSPTGEVEMVFCAAAILIQPRRRLQRGCKLN